MKQELCKCGGVKREGYEQCRKCYLDYYKNRTTKLCKGCNQELSLEKFRKRLNEDRPRSRCKSCEANAARKWRKENPEEHKRRKSQWAKNNPEKVKMSSLRRAWKKMGLDPLQVEIYKNTHSNVCEICGKMDEYQDISVDHCHDKKTFRGLLCSKCNMGIGLFQDNPQLLLKAIEYLNRPCVSHTLAQIHS